MSTGSISAWTWGSASWEVLIAHFRGKVPAAGSGSAGAQQSARTESPRPSASDGGAALSRARELPGMCPAQRDREAGGPRGQGLQAVEGGPVALGHAGHVDVEPGLPAPVQQPAVVQEARRLGRVERSGEDERARSVCVHGTTRTPSTSVHRALGARVVPSGGVRAETCPDSLAQRRRLVQRPRVWTGRWPGTAVRIGDVSSGCGAWARWWPGVAPRDGPGSPGRRRGPRAGPTPPPAARGGRRSPSPRGEPTTARQASAR